MHYRSNAAEAWYPEASSSSFQLQIDLLPPASLTQPLWKSLLTNLRDKFAPEKLPPLQLTSRPVDVGLLLGERLRLPWFRTVFTNIGDVISPETLPPLELESIPVDVGELITDQLSHFWFSSLLRNLADRLVPEKLPALQLTSKPVANIIGQGRTSEPTQAILLRDLRRSRIRRRIWIAMAAAQAIYLVAIVFWPH